jgi:large conductance mechanosensitive channel
MQGFKKFLLRGNVVDLAVGVVIGAAFSSVVDALVKGVLTPLIGLVGGVPDLSGLKVSAGNSSFLIGNFFNALISFIIVAAVVYFFVVIPMNKLVDRMKAQEKPADPATKKCSECLSDIPLGAKRCAFCTSIVPATL